MRQAKTPLPYPNNIQFNINASGHTPAGLVVSGIRYKGDNKYKIPTTALDEKQRQ